MLSACFAAGRVRDAEFDAPVRSNTVDSFTACLSGSLTHIATRLAKLLFVLAADGQLRVPADQLRTLSGEVVPGRGHLEKLIAMLTRCHSACQDAALLGMLPVF